MRGFLIGLTLLALAGGAYALWHFEVVELDFLPASPRADKTAEHTQTLFEVVKTGDLAVLSVALGEGADVNARDEFGQTPLMYASGASGTPDLLNLLLKAGADLNAQTETGWTALMYAARDAKDLNVPLFLMNAGADPSLRNAEGQSAADLARDNVAMTTSLYDRLTYLAARPFDTEWPSGYTVPIEGATISSRASHLPGAPRAYRNGTHEGFDFYSGSVSVPIEYGTPIHAVASGTVVRADTDYTEHTPEQYNQIIATAKRSLNTPPEVLDNLRGRQVWIEHPGGFISRYAHLSSIPAAVQLGATVSQGDVVGQTGNSGTLEAAQGTQDDPHPHVEIWRGEETYMGQGVAPDQIYTLSAQLFGEKSLPPYTGE